MKLIKTLLEVVKTTKEAAVRKTLVDTIKSKCYHNFMHLAKGGTPLYRGTLHPSITRLDQNYSFFVSAARTTPRRSATGNNVLLSYFDNSPEWKKFPKRSLSTSVTPSIDHASQFGDDKVWLIIPFDNVDKLAVVDEDLNTINFGHNDNYHNFLSLGSTLNEVIHEVKCIDKDSDDIDLKLDELLRNTALYIDLNDKLTIQDISDLSKALDKLSNYVLAMHPQYPDSISDLADDIDELHEELNGYTLMDFLDTYAIPAKIGARMLKYSDMQGNEIDSDSEIWFEGGYLGITELQLPYDLVKSDWFKRLVDDVNAD